MWGLQTKHYWRVSTGKSSVKRIWFTITGVGLSESMAISHRRRRSITEKLLVKNISVPSKRQVNKLKDGVLEIQMIAVHDFQFGRLPKFSSVSNLEVQWVHGHFQRTTLRTSNLGLLSVEHTVWHSHFELVNCNDRVSARSTIKSRGWL